MIQSGSVRVRFSGSRILLSVSILLFFHATLHAGAKIPALNDIPSILTTTEKARFDGDHQALATERNAFQAAGNAFNSLSAEQQSDEAFRALQTRRSLYISSVTAFNARLEMARLERISAELLKAVQESSWTVEEKARAKKALDWLDEDGYASTSSEIRQIWLDAQARRGKEPFAREAAAGTGPGLPGAGIQTNYEDCAVFALANAAGVPYGVVAARITKLIREGAWRPAEERTHPEKAIEESGLMGGEVILVAEALGQVTVVSIDEFEHRLKAGDTVLVNLVPQSGTIRSGHQVVLTKTFQHGGGTWFEVLDSNQQDSRQCLYFSEKELGKVIKESGIAFSRDPGTTPQFLRKK